MSNIYGYIRVSSKDQNEDRPLIALNEVGVELKNIYLDKKSGKDFDIVRSNIWAFAPVVVAFHNDSFQISVLFI